VSPVKYELGFYIPEDDILHSHRRESLKSYMNHIVTANVVPSSLIPSTMKIEEIHFVETLLRTRATG
jgi:hypothetical protein